MNVERIGDVAGFIWTKLRETSNGCVLSQLKKATGFTSDEIVAGIGWLAREGKINVETRGKKTTISLIEAEMLV